MLFRPLTCNEKNRPENWKSLYVTLCGIQCRFQNCLCFSSSIDCFWLLFFWRPMNETLQKSNFYNYHWLFIIIIIVLRNYMNASNHEIICAWMTFQPSCFILYFVYLWTLFFYELGDDDVTTLLWRHTFLDWLQWILQSICKSKINTILFMEISSFTNSFSIIYKRILWRHQVTMTSRIFYRS